MLISTTVGVLQGRLATASRSNRNDSHVTTRGTRNIATATAPGLRLAAHVALSSRCVLVGATPRALPIASQHLRGFALEALLLPGEHVAATLRAFPIACTPLPASPPVRHRDAGSATRARARDRSEPRFRNAQATTQTYERGLSYSLAISLARSLRFSSFHVDAFTSSGT